MNDVIRRALEKYREEFMREENERRRLLIQLIKRGECHEIYSERPIRQRDGVERQSI